MRLRNSDVHRRVWHHLTDAEKGSTLDLGPGEDAEVDVPEGFEDLYLVPVKKSRPSNDQALAAEKE